MTLSISPIGKERNLGEKNTNVKSNLVGVTLGPNRSNMCVGYSFISFNYCFLVQYIRSRWNMLDAESRLNEFELFTQHRPTFNLLLR